MSEPLLLRAAPSASADLFHAVPLDIIDPFLYAEVDDRRFAVNSVLERDRIEALGLGIEIIDPFELGMDELLNAGVGFLEAEIECDLRACREIGLEHAIVPPDFPLAWADRLREEYMELRVDADTFDLRRRLKTAAQIAGIRRAQVAADAAMAAATQLLRELPAGLTCEQVREEMQRVCLEHDAELPETAIVAHGAQSADGHEEGFGPIERGEVVLIDIWPRDRASRCWADMTRTFVAGGDPPPAELQEYWELTRASLDAVMAAIRPGAVCRELHGLSCEPFEAAGKPTVRTKEQGTVLAEGYYHGLGHGVGLEVHERPNLGRSDERLIAGDVVTVEPGCYRQGFGGVRLEDLLLVTEDGCEVLTDFPYELSP
jgi:Xaa-Pro aminopeptidase